MSETLFKALAAMVQDELDYRRSRRMERLDRTAQGSCR